MIYGISCTFPEQMEKEWNIKRDRDDETMARPAKGWISSSFVCRYDFLNSSVVGMNFVLT